MKKIPLLSFVVPVYNTKKYLRRCIESIETQDFDDYEIIIIDDGSTDDSGKLCDELASKNNKIKVIHKKNAGLGYARNTGIENSNGKYIWFIDSDDYIFSESISVLVKNLEDVDVVYFGFGRVKNNGFIEKNIPIETISKRYNDSEKIKELFSKFIYSNYNIFTSAWSCCIKKEFLENNKLLFASEREFISEDVYFFVKYFKYLKKITIINDALYAYCQNGDSLTTSYKEDRFIRLKKFYIEIKRIIAKDYNNLGFENVNNLFISNLIGCLKLEIMNKKTIGYRKSYNRVKNIVTDEFVYDSFVNYNKKVSRNWNILKFMIVNKNIIGLYIYLSIINYIKGI